MPSKPPTMSRARPRKAWGHRGKTATQRGYGRQHRSLREKLLRQEALCRLCQQKTPPRVTAATIADHIVSIAKGGAVHDINNLQPLCLECHQRKTIEEQGKRFKRRIGLAGWPED